MIKIIRRVKLATMFSIILFFVIFLITTTAYYKLYSENRAGLDYNLYSQAKSILDFADVLLESRNEKFFSGESNEVPQIIQNEIFSKFTDISNGEVYFKQASLSPMNPNNQANKVEEKILNYFKKNRDKEEFQIKIEEEGREFFMLARPIISDKRCKMCHPNWIPNSVIAIENVKIDLKEYKKTLSNNILIMGITWIISIILTIAVIQYLFQREIVARVQKFFQILLKIEKGNFAVESYFQNENLKDNLSTNEINRLFKHLNSMVNSLRPVIFSVTKQSKNVAFQASYASVKVTQNRELIENVVNSLESTKESIEKSKESSSKLSNLVESLELKSKESLLELKDSKNTLTYNVKSMDDSLLALNLTIDAIDKLQNSSKEINRAIEFINDIADETNLISLNAAIEASRAGEHGRAFAVVADKIRGLADKSLENTKTIQIVTKAMQESLDRVLNSINSTKVVFKSAKNYTNSMENNFIQIENTLLHSVENFKDFKSEFEIQNKRFNSGVKNLDNSFKVSRIMRENTEKLNELTLLISEESAKLNSLSNDFEIIKNKRKEKRTVVSPPKECLIYIREKEVLCYIFDISPDYGLSFYILENIDIENGEIVKFKSCKELENIAQRYKVIYQSDSFYSGIKFYGCRES